MNKFIQPSIGARFIAPTADYADLQINPDISRCRFIEHTADLSALGGLTNILITSLIRIIGPRWISSYPHENVHLHRLRLSWQ